MGAIFQADIWCDDCAEKIKDDFYAGRFDNERELTRDEWEVAHGFDDEYNYDSDEYPKYCDEESESDCPEHCAGCHEFLENDLTSDGANYVKETVREDIRSGHTDSIACTVWAPFYSWIDWEDIGYCDSCGELRDDLDSDGYCSGCVECYDSADCY